MNTKNIKKHLKSKMKDWLESIDDPKIKAIIQENTIITGGALVSLLTGDPVNDYDVYFKTKDACVAVAQYYVDLWNKTHPLKTQANIVIVDDSSVTQNVVDYSNPNPDGTYPQKSVTTKVDGRVKVFISSAGVAEEQPEDLNSDENPFDEESTNHDEKSQQEDKTEDSEDKPKYRPVFLTSNAITLSNKVQVVIRFYGDVSEIHKNYDFAHCTCSWTSWDNEVQLPTKALECIINKELYYIGSKYPLCSIIRTRKYLERGYHINAGQYVKMAFQLGDLNLHDINVLEDQLIGVDSGYFSAVIHALRAKYEKLDQKNLETTNSPCVENSYLFELLNRIF